MDVRKPQPNSHA